MKTPWLEVAWTNEHGKDVLRLICHDSELKEILEMPFPRGAVVREQVMDWNGGGTNVKFFRKCLVKVGDTFEESINQGMRPCTVVAVDDETGRFLYEYEMPNGTTALRTGGWDKGLYSVGGYSYKALPKKWRKLIAEAESELIGNPQGGNRLAG